MARQLVCYAITGYGPDAQPITLPLADISPHGFMADVAPCPVGARMRLMLPVAGVVAAQVRWNDGTRMGCKFDTAIDPVSYYQLLAEMLRPH